jgi:hypothetical protein
MPQLDVLLNSIFITYFHSFTYFSVKKTLSKYIFLKKRKIKQKLFLNLANPFADKLRIKTVFNKKRTKKRRLKKKIRRVSFFNHNSRLFINHVSNRFLVTQNIPININKNWLLHNQTLRLSWQILIYFNITIIPINCSHFVKATPSKVMYFTNLKNSIVSSIFLFGNNF